jgi:hypothetical protein
MCILLLMKPDIQKYKPKWQFGFTEGKGTSQAIAVWQWIRDILVGSNDIALCIFLDFEDAFTSVSHNFLFHAMQKAGIAHKLIRLTIALYAVATGRVRTRSSEGVDLYSPAYRIANGVVQGDCPAPDHFLLAMHILMDEIGLSPNPVYSPPVIVNTLGYADDLAQYFAQNRVDLENLEKRRPSSQGQHFLKLADITSKSSVKILKAFIDAENSRRASANISPLNITQRKVRATMYQEIQDNFPPLLGLNVAPGPCPVTPIHSEPMDEWKHIAETASTYIKNFSIKAFDRAALILRPDKSKVLPLGFDPHLDSCSSQRTGNTECSKTLQISLPRLWQKEISNTSIS